MADRSISIQLSADVRGLVSGFRTAAQATKDASGRLEAFAKQHEQSLDRVGKAGIVMGGGLVAGIGLAIKSYAEFDKAMSSVAASSHETAGNLEMLRQAAIEAGADTAFSASQAANAIDELTKAGVGTADILNGGLKGALNLAAAGSLDVGQAAEFAASAMTQFRLQGSDIPHIADLLAAGAGKAQGSVQDMGLALSYAGVPAKGLGMTIEETAGAIALFSSNGITGEKAGTALRSMLVSMTNPVGKTRDLMDSLGVSFFDSKDKFIGLEKVAGMLQERLGGLGEGTRNAALAQIFGTEALGAAQAMYAGGADKVKEWAKAVDDSGYALETAALKTDNLSGDFERLTGSLDSVFLKSASGANTALRGLVQGAEDFVDSIGQIPAPVLQAGLGIAGVAGGMLLAGGAFATALPRIMEGVSAFRDLQKAAPGAASALKGAAIAGTIVSIGVALGKIAEAKASDQIERSVGRTTSALVDMAAQRDNIEQTTKALDYLFKTKDGGDLVGGVSDLDSALTRMFKKDFGQTANDWGNDMAKALSLGTIDFGTMKTLGDSFKNIDDQLASFVGSGNADIAAKSFSRIEEKAKAQGISLDQLKTAFPGYFEALKQADADARVAAEGMEKITTAAGQVVPISPEVQKSLDDLGISAQAAVLNLDKYAAALVRAGLSNLSVSDATRNYEAAIDAVTAAIATNGTTLDVHTDKGRANQAALEGIASAGLSTVQTMAKATDAYGNQIYTADQLHATMATTYTDFVKAAGQFGITGAAADSLARKALGIPKGVNIQAYLKDFASQQLDAIGLKADRLNGKQSTVTILERTIRSIETQVRGGGSASDPSDTALRPGSLRKAVGGAIIGPGTGTSDEIPALLSNGEHVLTAAEVSRMGGQSAVYRFRQMLDAGKLPKFAVGGAVERANYRREQRDALNLDYSRGQAYQTVNDSLSSAYSFSDRLRSVGTSGNVANGGALVAKANAADSVLRGLFGRSEKLAKSLEAAKAKFDSLVQVRDGIKSALSGEFSLSDATKQSAMYKGAASVKDIQASASSVLTRIRGFAGKLKRLQQMGYSGAILQEIAGMGSEEGGAAADALLAGSKSDVRSLNSTYSQIGTASASAGTYVTDAMYKGGVKAAQGVLDGLTKQEKAIEKQMLKIGLSMENSLRSAVGARPLHKAGGGRVYGPGTETSDSVPHMLSKDEYVIQARAAKAIGYAELDRMNNGQMKPVITYRPARVGQSSAGNGGGVTFGDVTISQQSDPVATFHEFSRRAGSLAT